MIQNKIAEAHLRLRVFCFGSVIFAFGEWYCGVAAVIFALGEWYCGVAAVIFAPGEWYSLRE